MDITQKMRKLFLLLFLPVTIVCNAQIGKIFEVSEVHGNKLRYEVITNNTVKLLYSNKYEKYKQISIPETVVYKGNTYTVTSLQSFFSGNEYLEEIHFPNTITEIPPGFAWDFKNLTQVEIPNSVTKLGESCFRGCVRLQDVTLPENLQIMERNCFMQCESLTHVKIPDGVTDLQSKYEYGVYSGGCFSECKNLEYVKLPKNLKSIGAHSFFKCHKLKSITFPKSLEVIGESAFEGCESLTDIRGFHDGIKLKVSFYLGTSITSLPFEKSCLDSLKNTFAYYAEGRIQKAIGEWQKKRDFETRAQYQERLSKENQNKKVQELVQEAIKGYTAKYPLNASLGAYDADYQLYKIQTRYGDKYVKVPLSEAPSFKQNFKNTDVTATYVATKDGLVINDLSVTINGKSYLAEKSALEVASYNVELPEVEMPYQQQRLSAVTTPVNTDQSIDQNIPTNVANNYQTFAVIIGNERYTQVAQVPYANNDAKIFAEYCKKTLGLPAQNVRTYDNATYGTMLSAVADIKKIAEAYNGNINIIFYYAGHGVPNESTKDAFLLPVDANGQQTEACYPVSRLYKELGALGAKNVVMFMDACFSGAQRGEGMLASVRGVALKAKAEAPQGNMVVFSAASGDETAYPYKEKGHGMFTYFLLKKLQESKGDCTLQELGEYIQTNVRQQSVVINRKSQTPTVVPSAGVSETWKNMKLTY